MSWLQKEVSINSSHAMSWVQKEVQLKPKSRGCHLITDELLQSIHSDLQKFEIGMCNLFLKHTSAALTLNENCDPDVRSDMENAMNRIVPEDTNNTGLYKHADEGSDDMPGHVKSSLMGVSHTIPICNGRLNTGTWQGVWLHEFRDRASGRTVVVTINGKPKF